MFFPRLNTTLRFFRSETSIISKMEIWIKTVRPSVTSLSADTSSSTIYSPDSQPSSVASQCTAPSSSIIHSLDSLPSSVASPISSLVQSASDSSPPTSVTVVMGNEACDQDSGVSSLAYAFHLHLLFPNLLIIPVLNIFEEDFDLKTELVASLEEVGIGKNDMVFRDTFDIEALGDSVKVVLVDHNALADKDVGLNDKVVEVIDHHVKEREGENVLIEPVGSCCTLVAEKIFSENRTFDDKTTLNLIYKTILLDTVCLEEKAKRVTPKDVKIIEAIEEKIGKKNRKDVFDKVWRDKQKIDHLSPYQLLKRDLKMVTGKNDNVTVAMSSVPMLVQNFLKLENVEQDLKKFAKSKFICIIMGIQIEDGLVKRDLFVYNSFEKDDTKDMLKKVVNDLTEAKTPNLLLVKENHSFGELFVQENSAASRKQVLPLVKKTVDLM